MSELKSYIGPHPTDHTLTEYYLKSEADEVIAKLKEQVSEERSAKVDYKISANDLSNGLKEAREEIRRLHRCIIRMTRQWLSAIDDMYSRLDDVHCISGPIISKFVPEFRYCPGVYYKEDFIENSQQDEELHLGCYVDNGDDSWVCDFAKSLLMLTDEQINEIVEYDRKKKEEEYKRQEEAEKARKEKLKEEVEEKEYEQYLRLKKKFEKE